MTQALWRGPFGDDYTRRNIGAGDRRGPFWQRYLSDHPVGSVLEVGCNVGANLRWLVERIPSVAGIDLNEAAVAIARARFVDADIELASATALPFADRSVELVLTSGLLIHLDDVECEQAIREAFRVSSKYVLLMEYFAPKTTPVPYRGREKALWKRNWIPLVGGIVRLVPEHVWLLGEAEGFDNVYAYCYRVRP